MSKMENPKNSFGKRLFISTFEFVTLLPKSLPFSFMVSWAEIMFRNQTDYGHIIVSIKQEIFLSNVVRVIYTIGNKFQLLIYVATFCYFVYHCNYAANWDFHYVWFWLILVTYLFPITSCYFSVTKIYHLYTIYIPFVETHFSESENIQKMFSHKYFIKKRIWDHSSHNRFFTVFL